MQWFPILRRILKVRISRPERILMINQITDRSELTVLWLVLLLEHLITSQILVSGIVLATADGTFSIFLLTLGALVPGTLVLCSGRLRSILLHCAAPYRRLVF